MKHSLLLSAIAAVLVAGCSSAPEEAPAGNESTPETAPVVTASYQAPEGTCPKCNSKTYDGHLCGKTTPCRLCQREAGAGHRHFLIWACGPCSRSYRESHACNNATTCPTCRPEGMRRMPAKTCVGCGGILTALEARGATTYCAECNLETGPNHLHGKTKYCSTCEREAGNNHRHQATQMCDSCGTEVAPDHVHGLTGFCTACGLDQGLDHQHGRTTWCLRCKGEKVEPHTVHVK